MVIRRVGIAILSRVVSVSCGMKFTDVTSGLRVYNRRATLFLAWTASLRAWADASTSVMHPSQTR